LVSAATITIRAGTTHAEHHLSDDPSKGRIVRQAIWLAPAPRHRFSLRSQRLVIRRRTFDDAGQWLSEEIVHRVTNLSGNQTAPKNLARVVHAHWTIENKSHRVRGCRVSRKRPTHPYRH
jgi:hypothetical protein